MNQEVLVLNSDFEPLNVCNLRRAVVLVYMGKADILHTDDFSEPVTLVDGVQHDFWRVSEDRLRAALRH